MEKIPYLIYLDSIFIVTSVIGIGIFINNTINQFIKGQSLFSSSENRFKLIFTLSLFLLSLFLYNSITDLFNNSTTKIYLESFLLGLTVVFIHLIQRIKEPKNKLEFVKESQDVSVETIEVNEIKNEDLIMQSESSLFSEMFKNEDHYRLFFKGLKKNSFIRDNGLISFPAKTEDREGTQVALIIALLKSNGLLKKASMEIYCKAFKNSFKKTVSSSFASRVYRDFRNENLTSTENEDLKNYDFIKYIAIP